MHLYIHTVPHVFKILSYSLCSCNFMIVYYVYQIPRDILLEVLGPSKVYKEVIKKVINSTVAEYVEKVTSTRLCYAVTFFISLPTLHLENDALLC